MLGTHKQAELKRGAKVFQEIQILHFLGNTNAEGRYKGELKFITDRKNVTEDEVEAYYRNGIRKFISDIVDEEFGKAGEQGVIPARVYADWERQKFVVVGGKAVNGTELIKQVLGDFFLNPTETNYVRVLGMIARIFAQRETSYTNTVNKAFADTITCISLELATKIKDGWGGAQGIYAAARQPNDPAFRIFEIPYSVGR
jgi:hypothetical protein